MDIGILTLDAWYEWVALYVAGILPSWLVFYRNFTEWQLVGEDVVRRWQNNDTPGETLFFSLIWPLTILLGIGCCVIDKLDNSRFVDGKPPKNLVVLAHEKKVDRLLKEET